MPGLCKTGRCFTLEANESMTFDRYAAYYDALYQDKDYTQADRGQQHLAVCTPDDYR